MSTITHRTAVLAAILAVTSLSASAALAHESEATPSPSASSEAHTPTPAPTKSASSADRMTASPTPKATPATSAADRLAAIKAKGDADIAARLASLKELITKVNSIKKLTAEQKSSLVTDIQGQITGLTALKATLDADTTADAARADFAKIFSEHFVYAFFQPRIDRLAAADAATSAVTSLNAMVPKLQAYIYTAQQQGKDVASLQASLNDMKAKIAEAQTQATAALTALTPLNTTEFKKDRTVVSSQVPQIKDSRSALDAARKDAHAIVDGLKKLLSGVN